MNEKPIIIEKDGQIQLKAKKIEDVPLVILRLIWNSSILEAIHGTASKIDRDTMLEILNDANFDVEMINNTFLKPDWNGYY